MSAFVLTALAKADLKDIARHTQQRWGREQRNLYLKQLDDAFHALARSPQRGRACDYVRPGYRKLLQGGHVVYYRERADAMIEVVRILHQSMDVDLQLPGASGDTTHKYR